MKHSYLLYIFIILSSIHELYASEEFSLNILFGNQQSRDERDSLAILLSRNTLQTAPSAPKIQNSVTVSNNVAIITRFYDAARYGIIDEVKLLADFYGVNICDRQGNTPLHYAVREQSEGNEHVITFLLKNGANIHAKNNKQKSPRGIALVKRHIKLWALLIKHGAKLKYAEKIKTRNRSGTY